MWRNLVSGKLQEKLFKFMLVQGLGATYLPAILFSGILNAARKGQGGKRSIWRGLMIRTESQVSCPQKADLFQSLQWDKWQYRAVEGSRAKRNDGSRGTEEGIRALPLQRWRFWKTRFLTGRQDCSRRIQCPVGRISLWSSESSPQAQCLRRAPQRRVIRNYQASGPCRCPRCWLWPD